MKKGIVALIVVAVLVLAVWGIFGGNNSDDLNSTGKVVSDFSGKKVMIDSDASMFEFTAGKVVGKAHVGTFESWEGAVYLSDGKVSGIEGVAQVSSVKTDSSAVDGHLQKDDFFDAENYPEIRFTSTNVDVDKEEITGVLEMAGKQKELVVSAEFDEGSVSGEFSFSADEFFKFDVLMTDVEIRFDFVY